MINLTFYKSTIRSDGEDNGGGMSGYRVISGQNSNLFKFISPLEVAEGLTRYRKIFFVPDYDYTLLDEGVIVLLSRPSQGEDGCLIHSGTDTDTQAEADDYTGWKGVGVTQQPLQFGMLSWVEVLTEFAQEGFSADDWIVISDDDNFDFVQVESVEWVSDYRARLNFYAGSLIYHAYASEVYASACVKFATLQQSAVWMKSVIPQDIRTQDNNLYRLRVLAW